MHRSCVDDVLLGLVARDRVRGALDLAHPAPDARFGDEMRHKAFCNNPLRGAPIVARYHIGAGSRAAANFHCGRALGTDGRVTPHEKDVRAVVLGLLVVVLVAMGFAMLARPGPGVHAAQGIPGRGEEDRRRRDAHLPLHGPGRPWSRGSRGSPGWITSSTATFGRPGTTATSRLARSWTPRTPATPEQPGVIEERRTRVEVRSKDGSLLIDVKDNWDQQGAHRGPPPLVEVFVDDEPLTTREMLQRLDELGPATSSRSATARTRSPSRAEAAEEDQDRH